MKHYVIGDVHGHYDTLIKLINQLDTNSTLIFVGDLIDRGPKSKKVINLIRNKNYLSVLGNHEDMMIKYGKYFIKNYPNDIFNDSLLMWYYNGGLETLKSYNLIKQKNNKIICTNNKKALDEFYEDIKWMETLPIYIKMPQYINKKPVVVTHANCIDAWPPSDIKIFKHFALWNRNSPKNGCEIFNIHGHTPVPFGIKVTQCYANIDTGCYLQMPEYGMLSAFCIETKEAISIARVEK